MKHILVYLIAAVLIFSYINFFVSPEEKADTGFLPAQLTLAAIAPAADTEQSTATVKTGVIFKTLDSLDAVYCKNALTESLGDGFDLRVSEAVGKSETQREIFDKMVEKDYKLIFIELFEGSETEYFVNTAMTREITLVFLGDAPAPEVMEQMDNLYYIGFDQKGASKALGEAVAKMWMTNRETLDFDEDGIMEYSVLSREGFQESGCQDELEDYLDGIGLENDLVIDFLTDDVTADVEKGIDQMIIDDSELFVCVESSNAKRLVNYLNDPTEFNSWPDLQIAVLSVDEDARKLVSDGYAAIAVGYDGSQLGEKAARLAQMILGGETPDEDSMGLTMEDGRYFYISPTTLRATHLTAKAAELD